jgi:hypothetical protein
MPFLDELRLLSVLDDSRELEKGHNDKNSSLKAKVNCFAINKHK